MDKVNGLCSLEVLIKRCSSPRKELHTQKPGRVQLSPWEQLGW